MSSLSDNEKSPKEENSNENEEIPKTDEAVENESENIIDNEHIEE